MYVLIEDSQQGVTVLNTIHYIIATSRKAHYIRRMS